MPTAGVPQPSTPLPPKPITSPPLTPTAPIVPAPTPQNKEISALVRTMESDIKAVGQNLPNKGGVEVKVGGGPVVPIVPPIVPVVKPISPTPAQTNSGNVALGPSEKRTSPMPVTATPVPPKPAVPPIAPAGIILPPTGSKKSVRPLFLGLIILVVLVAALGIYWLLAPGSEPAPTPFPTRTPSSTPEFSATPVSGPVDDLNFIFVNHGTIIFAASSSSQFVPMLYDQLATNSSTAKNSLLAPLVSTSATSTAPLPFSGFVRLAAIAGVSGDTNGLLDSNFALVISRQTEKFTSKGALVPGSPAEQRLGLVVGVSDTAITTSWLTNWEKTIATDLSTLFRLGSTPSNVVFKNNAYRGMNIRYANFTQPDRSIDYAVVRAVNGKSYLVIANSREQIYGIIDNLLGF